MMVWERRVYSNKMGAKVGQLWKMTLREPFAKICSEVPLQIFIICLLWGDKTTFKSKGGRKTCTSGKVAEHPLIDFNQLLQNKQHDIVE